MSKRKSKSGEVEPVSVKFKGTVSVKDIQKIGPNGQYTEVGRRIKIIANSLRISARSIPGQPLTEFRWIGPGNSMVVATKHEKPDTFERSPIGEEIPPITNALIVIPEVKI